ncbi:MAG: hypothetical protein JWN61_2408 [Pseudonocardiales bacterium]|nr:hypothetical protein [Pseudonocardiales bacterium]
MRGRSKTPASNSADPSKTAFVIDERMRVPWWWYPSAALIGAVLAGQFRLALYSLPEWLPFAILIPLAMLLAWRAGASRLQVGRGELRVRDAHIPLDVVGEVVELDARTVRLLAGRRGDPAAFVMLAPWIGPGLQVMNEDPDDPAPYWLFSTRHPHEVATALRATSS